MNTQTIRKILTMNGTHIFSVVFTKKDGTKRRMVCRLGVTKHLKNGVERVASTTSHIPKYLTVYDMENHGYRNINVETIESIKMQGSEVSL